MIQTPSISFSLAAINLSYRAIHVSLPYKIDLLLPLTARKMCTWALSVCVCVCKWSLLSGKNWTETVPCNGSYLWSSLPLSNGAGRRTKKRWSWLCVFGCVSGCVWACSYVWTCQPMNLEDLPTTKHDGQSWQMQRRLWSFPLNYDQFAQNYHQNHTQSSCVPVQPFYSTCSIKLVGFGCNCTAPAILTGY